MFRFYAGLGATGDFHDELISYAYERQILTDPNNIPYYLECLQAIGENRESEMLQTLAAIQESSGKISLKDIRSAYKNFALDFPVAYLDDDTIIGTFQSRVSDAPRQEPQLRRALKIIGQHRSSEKIQQVASNGRCVPRPASQGFFLRYLNQMLIFFSEVSNYEQAISWLGATEDIDDGFLVSMHCNKVSCE